MSRVQLYIGQVSRFKKLDVRVLSLVKLADLAWQFDASLARSVFVKTYESLKALAPSDIAKDDDSRASQDLRNSLSRLSAALISLLARHDPSLARQLKVIGGDIEAGARLKRAELNSALRSLIEENDSGRAAEIGERALRGDIGEDASSLLILLNQLRLKDEEAANRLFEAALQRVNAQRYVAPGTLMLLGSYLFGDPRLIGSPEQETRIRYVSVAGIQVANLYGERAGLPPSIVEAYLETAVAILSRPVSDPHDKPYYYATGYQLAPKVERVLPNKVGSLRLALSYLAPDVSPALTQASTYAGFAAAEQPFDLATAVAQIEKIGGVQLRDMAYLRVASTRYSRGDLDGAAALADKIQDTAVRRSINNIVGACQAIRALARGQMFDAEAIASKLPPGIPAAVAWLEIGHTRLEQSRAQQGSAQMSREAFAAAVKAAALTDERGFVSLIAAGELSRIDSVDAFGMLAEAVHMLNSGKASRASWSGLWRQKIELGEVSRIFSLPRRAGSADWVLGLHDLARVNLQQTEDAVMLLDAEDLAGDALVALVSDVLQEINRAKSKK